MEPPELERGSNASGEHSALLLSWKDLSVYSRCVGRGAGSAARNPKALASPNSPLCLCRKGVALLAGATGQVSTGIHAVMGPSGAGK